ncbi:MAG TPA: hypothetical protein VNX01_04540 [Bacteroidia bacterium]|nr:hypothetical protein [Bacteroidia bacterium]
MCLFATSKSLLQAQTKACKLDSLRDQFIKDSTWIFRPKNVFPLLASDQRNSYIGGKPVNIWGIKGGVTLFDRHNVGLGVYSVTNSTQRYIARQDRTINQNTTLQYLTAFYEYSFIERRWWEVGIPIEIGGGMYNIGSTDVNTNKALPNRKGLFIPLGTALDVYFKPTRWFAINVMGGYRVAITDNARLNFNGWFYSFGGAIYLRQILQDLRYYNKKRIYKKELEIVNRLPD